MTRPARLTAALAAAGIVPCGDSLCIFGRPDGMHTNGGCRCLRDDIGTRESELLAAKRLITRMAAVIRELAKEPDRPLTVGEALKLPEVRSGAKWVEMDFDGERHQMKLDPALRLSHHDGAFYYRHQRPNGTWAPWGYCDIAEPDVACTLVDPDGAP